MDFVKSSQDLFDYSRSLRRDFHRYPELGFQEVRTAGIVARELNQMGLEVTTKFAKTGVVGLLEGGKPGPILLLRFDMDALPILEETNVEFASSNKGVMHACGHDGHTAIGLTVARLLSDFQPDLNGTVKFVFQPAEEGLGGAKLMVKEGVMENPRPDFCLALHLWNNKPVGWLGIASGPVMAASDFFSVKISGIGGHGASPDLTVDPVIASAHIITSLQTIVSRKVPPVHPAVISVTTIHAGDAHNVIPQEVRFTGTIRAFNPDVHKLILDQMERIVEHSAKVFGCTAELEVESITSAVVNDSTVTSIVDKTAQSILKGVDIDRNFRATISEDMSFMMEIVPGCYFMVGSGNSDKGFIAPHHHPKFNFDEEILPQAAALMASAAVGILQGEK